MKSDMITKLHRIKSALRESIEIAGKATEGPWEIGSGKLGYKCSLTNKEGLRTPVDIRGPSEEFGSPSKAAEANTIFISHARTMTPLACKALLLAIEALESIQLLDFESYSEKALTSIISTWPDA